MHTTVDRMHVPCTDPSTNIVWLCRCRYATLVSPIVLLLERHVRDTAACVPETPRETAFLANTLPQLRAAVASLRSPENITDYAAAQVGHLARHAHQCTFVFVFRRIGESFKPR